MFDYQQGVSINIKQVEFIENVRDTKNCVGAHFRTAAGNQAYIFSHVRLKL